MLILSRKEGESIVLQLPSGEDVLITLAEYKGQQTKVAIDAPENVTILREELLSDV